MKVSYISPFFFDESNGRLGRFHDLMGYLNKNSSSNIDHRIHSFINSGEDPILRWMDADYFWSSPVNNIECAFNIGRIKKEIQEYSPDILHIFKFHPACVPLVKSINDPAPIFVGPNIGGWFPTRDQDYWLEDWLSMTLSQADYISKKAFIQVLKPDRLFSFSQYHSEMIKTLGVKESQITKIRPFIGTEFIQKSQMDVGEPITILYVGDKTEQKGFCILIEALEKLSLNQQLHVEIVGASGATINNVENDSITVNDNGFIKRKNLPALYGKADLFVMPSTDEMGPNTILEAIGSGTPVVATDEPGINEFVPEGMGILFRQRNSTDLAGSLETAIHELEQLTDEVRPNIYECKRVVGQLEEEYETYLNGCSAEK
jgi:glycosyltransferase involved in cell wall biosynthesis